MLLISLIAFVVRIGILVEVDRVGISGEDFVVKSKGKWFHAKQEMVCKTDRIEYGGKRAKELWYPIIIRPKKGLLKVNRRLYPGELLIKKGELGLVVINYVELEDYVASVVRFELGCLKPDLIEALKAQAVAARTYCIRHLKKHDDLGFDLISGIEDQVYRGYVDDTIINKAVYGTSKKILVFNGQPIDAKYHSTCGGLTASASDVWPVGDVPYLTSVNDRDFCQKSPHRRWQKSLSLAFFYRVLRRLVRNSLDGQIRLKITRSGRSKRLLKLALVSKNNQYEIPGYVVRKAFDLKSTLFKITFVKDTVIFNGYGWGHGVGMCQWGAIGMAEKGYDYRDILRHYYPKTKLAHMK